MQLQHDKKDCGPACLQYVGRHHGLLQSLQSVRRLCATSREGVSFFNLSKAAGQMGFRATGVRLSYAQLTSGTPLPCIAHWKQRHFVVVINAGKRKVKVYDPAYGELTYSREAFLRGWALPGHTDGICLLLEPTPALNRQDRETDMPAFGMKNLLPWFRPYRKFLLQLLAGVFLGTLLQLSVPFLTQAVIDLGIHQQNTTLITVILLAQLFLFLSQLSVEFVRNRILLHVNARVNISVISDFIRRLIQKPMPFFDTRHIGDIIQRIGDQKRIEHFLTNTFVSALYFILNILVFGLVLLLYSPPVFLVFLAGFGISSAWILLFMRKRARLDFKRFGCQAENHSKIVQLISGMADIKLANAEQQKRWEWEQIQAGLFNVNVSGLSVDQYQRSGAAMINRMKNLAIMGMTAVAVMNGTMSMGMMMAVIFILGQLNSPLSQLVTMARSYQEARLSLDRLGEVLEDHDAGDSRESLAYIPDDGNISLSDVSFSYDPYGSETALQNINLDIPAGKVTAVVGPSGCGKTTLLRLLLGFYHPRQGTVSVGGVALHTIRQDLWRDHCGAVLQDGYLFSDTVMNNITMNAAEPDLKRMLGAVEMANIKEYIEQLPRNYYTVIGPNGRSLSQGQKQRLLIARALYKNPRFLLLDEATNALDARNERSILNNLRLFAGQRTVLVIAHRLSTVKHADKIVVMDGGRIVETGTHAELLQRKGFYHQLINHQTDMDYETHETFLS